MPVIVVVMMLTAGVAAGTAAPTGSGAGPVEGASVAADLAVNETTNESTNGTTQEPTNGASGDYQPIEPPRNWTKKPVLDTEIERQVSAFGISSQGLTRQFLTSGPQGYRLMTFEQRAVGDNIEVWVATNLSWGVAGNRSTPEVSDAQVQHLVREFDDTIYPNETRIFGQPAPRDGSEALLGGEGYYNTTENAGNKTVLLVQNIRDQNYYNPDYPLYIAGYYSPTVQTYSDRNVITVDAYGWSNVTAEDPMVGIEGTLAHEYQHLIHADLDGDETTWINEGMSDYAEVAVGYGAPESHISAYEQSPSNSLTNWEDQGAINVLADYGIAAAFTMYLDDRYGTDFISNLAREEKNGIAGVEATLDETGAKTDFYALYQDFSTAALLDDNASERFHDRWDIAGLELALNTTGGPGTAGAWGTDYRTIDTSDEGPIKGVTVSGINYTGTEWTTTADPTTGTGQVLHSGSGNLLDRHAIVETDLSDASNPTLSFDSFQRIEENWDYGFVQVSTDGGETWHSLSNNNTGASPAPSAHPTVVENLPGLTGDTDGWEHQEFDLSAYAGNESVLVSFRYVTDWAAVQPGWFIRNVTVAGESIPTDTTAPYMSEREATENPLEYQFSFVGFKKHGDHFKIEQLDAQTFPDGGEEDIRRFKLRGNYDRVVVMATWAAEMGESGRVPYNVTLHYAGDHQGPPWWHDDDDDKDDDHGPPWAGDDDDDGGESDDGGASPPWGGGDDDGEDDDGHDNPWGGDDDDDGHGGGPWGGNPWGGW